MQAFWVSQDLSNLGQDPENPYYGKMAHKGCCTQKGLGPLAGEPKMYRLESMVKQENIGLKSVSLNAVTNIQVGIGNINQTFLSYLTPVSPTSLNTMHQHPHE